MGILIYVSLYTWAKVLSRYIARSEIHLFIQYIFIEHLEPGTILGPRDTITRIRWQSLYSRVLYSTQGNGQWQKQVKCRVYQVSSVAKNKAREQNRVRWAGPVLLHRVIVEGHTLKVNLKRDMKEVKNQILHISGGRELHRGNSMCTGPEAGTYLAY